MDDWIKNIDENPKGSTTPIAIVGTKSDKSRVVKENQAYVLQEQINDKSGMERCSLVLETSAFEDYDSVKTMLSDVAKDIVKKE